MSSHSKNSGSDSENEEEANNLTNISTRPTTSLEKAHHYFLVALAGDEVKAKLAADAIQKEDTEKFMLQFYLNAVDKYMAGECEEANRFDLSKPEGLSRDVLICTDSRSRNRGSNSGTVTGDSLWRKYQELVSYLVNYANPVWDLHISLGKNKADCLHAVKLQLWEKVENERVERVRASGKTCTPKSFRSTWMPKEWLAFVTLGPPAGDYSKKSLCTKSKHAAQISTAAKAVAPLVGLDSALSASNNGNSSSSSINAAIQEVSMLGKRAADHAESSGKKIRIHELPLPSGLANVVDSHSAEVVKQLTELVKLKTFELKLHAMERLLALSPPVANATEMQQDYEALLHDYVDTGKY